VRVTSDSILPWLLAVANNCLRNATRTRRRYRRLLVKLPPTQDVASFEVELTERIDDASRMRELLAVLQTLATEDQEIISLCDWSRLSYGEAASALNIPVGMVKSRLSRARERLRAAHDLTDPRTQTSTELGGVVK
jgi:RNA polymerase sigma factor (sigma-70 family)